jgi:tRNA A-37 threonylcarbamoyl transferase component Bud32
MHLLKALSTMLDVKDPIIHYDLKNKSIIYLTDKGPIIIDFGMSFIKSQLLSAVIHPEKLNDFFWNYQATADDSLDTN